VQSPEHQVDPGVCHSALYLLMLSLFVYQIKTNHYLIPGEVSTCGGRDVFNAKIYLQLAKDFENAEASRHIAEIPILNSLLESAKLFMERRDFAAAEQELSKLIEVNESCKYHNLLYRVYATSFLFNSTI